MAKIESLRDALVADDSAAIASATSDYPACTGSACLATVADAFGSKKGYVAQPPDHAGASTAALVLVRDGHGEWLGPVDPWLSALKSTKGVGMDNLRLAVARKMADSAPAIGRKIEDDGAAKAALLAVVSSIPGACPTYRLVGEGADPKTIAPELTADHSACVQKDLSRREGPGGTYGSGTFRALEGALALWRETERALRVGLPQADPGPKAVLEKKLAVIEAATAKSETKKLPATASETAILNYMRELHADAGVVTEKPEAGLAPSSSPSPTAAPRR
jgi:hypothetical protein